MKGKAATGHTLLATGLIIGLTVQMVAMAFNALALSRAAGACFVPQLMPLRFWLDHEPATFNMIASRAQGIAPPAEPNSIEVNMSPLYEILGEAFC